jgi:acyl-CoA oxidase
LLIGHHGFPLSLHFTMVVPMLMNNADDEQMEWWFQKAVNREFVGTYAQTEIGHGTNLKKLETTAVYDPKSQEFVLNTPTITATKWWPGNLGKSTNFILVMAQLWTQGKVRFVLNSVLIYFACFQCHGAYPFMVQIRHPDTHQPMPGITVGDIGPKYGANSNDNGFLRLNNVRIPRRNMLMKHAKVHPDGRFEPPIHEKLSYTGMMYIRSVN